MIKIISILLAAFMAFGVHGESENNTEPRYLLEISNYAYGLPVVDFDIIELPAPCVINEVDFFSSEQTMDELESIDFEFTSDGPTCSGGGATCECQTDQCCQATSSSCSCDPCETRSRLGRLIDRIL